MSYQIEIWEDTTGNFRICPVKVDKELMHELGLLRYERVEKVGDLISIDDGDLDTFLYYFLNKYFDQNLDFNSYRFFDDYDYIEGFAWNLFHNFYTYDTMYDMLAEIDEVACMLETDYDNPALDEVKKEFSIYYMCDEEDEDYKKGNSAAIKDHIDVVIDFYRRFTERVRKMMADCPRANLISIDGP